MGLRVRRDDDRRDTGPGPPLVDARGRDMIPAAAVLVVGDDDRGRVPIRRAAHGVDQLLDVVLSGDQRRVVGVIVLDADRFDEGDTRETPRAQVSKESLLVLQVGLEVLRTRRAPALIVGERLMVILKAVAVVGGSLVTGG